MAALECALVRRKFAAAFAKRAQHVELKILQLKKRSLVRSFSLSGQGDFKGALKRKEFDLAEKQNFKKVERLLEILPGISYPGPISVRFGVPGLDRYRLGKQPVTRI